MKKLTLILIALLGITVIASAQNMGLNFDGTDDYVNCGNGASVQIGNTITLEAWIYPTAFGVNFYDNTIISKENTSVGFQGYILRCGSAGILNFTFGDNSGAWYQLNSPSGALALNTWSHVAGAYDGSTMRIYVNGVSVADAALNVGMGANTTDNLTIGTDLGYPTRLFQGKIDEVRIWNVARSITQIPNNMYNQLLGTETGLAAYYNSNATIGTILVDNTANANTGTLINMVGTEWTPSSAFFGPKNSLIFDGALNQSVYCGTGLSAYIAGTGGFSVEAWIYPTDFKTSTLDNTIADNTSTGFGFILRCGGSGVLEAVLGIGGVWTILTSPNNVLVLNKWQHVVVTYDGANLVLYVNGVQVASVAETGSVGNSAQGFAIAANVSFNNSRFFTGNIDEVRVWDDARTLTEIRENMNKALSGSETSLVAYYNFDSNNGGSLQDFSPNTNTGTLGNMDGATDWVASTAYNTWLNTNSTAWETGANWSEGTVPDLNDNVGIPNSGGSQPTSTTTVTTCNNLVVESGATLTYNVSGSHTIHGSAFVIGTSDINSGNLLTITKSLYILPLSTLNVKAGGQLTVSTNLEVLSTGNCNLKSDATGTGSLIVNGTATGSIVQERYIGAATWGTWDDGWHFLSSPVAGYAIQDNFTVATATDYDFYAWSEPDNLWINFKTGDTPSFLTVNGSNNFELGHGYMAAYATAATKNFTGTINLGDVTITGLTNSGGVTDYHSWHLLGNPFNSALTWDNTWTTTNIGANIQIWNEAGTSYTVIANSPGGVIPATNGFMIQGTDATAASVTIPASKRVHSTQAFYKGVNFPIIKLKANNIDNPSFQESQLLFNPESTTGYEPEYDCDFLAGYAPLFYSTIENRPMALNNMPNVEETTNIPFTFIKNEGLNFSIEMYEVENMEFDVWLFDNKLNKDHNLTQNPVYYFTAFENDNPERFNIHFSPLGVDEPTTKTQLIQIWAANSTINIFNNENLAGDVKVLNMFGQVILKTQLNGDNNQQLIINTPSGYYIVNIVTNKGVVNKKVYIR